MKFTRLIVAIIVTVILFSVIYSVIPLFGSIFFQATFREIASSEPYGVVGCVLSLILTGIFAHECFTPDFYWK